jgi:hypothetical protein
MDQWMDRSFSTKESSADRFVLGASVAHVLSTANVGFSGLYRLLGITTSHLPDH